MTQGLGYPVDPNCEEDDEYEKIETNLSFDDILHATEERSWGQGYELGRRQEWLHAHSDLVVMMYENLRKADYPVRESLRILADCMGVTYMEIECMLPAGITEDIPLKM